MRTRLYRSPVSQLTEKEVVTALKRFSMQNKAELNSSNIHTLLISTGNSSLYKRVLHYGGLHYFNTKYCLKLKLKHRGRTQEEILATLKAIKEQGYPITQQSLIDLGQSGVLNSIWKYGNLNDFKAQLGLPIRKMTKWTKEKVISKYLMLYEQLGREPSGIFLYNNGYNDLKGAIRTHFGSIVALRKEMGLTTHKKPTHYWTLEKTLQEFKTFIQDNRVILKTNSVYGTLEAQKLHGLRTAIGHWGGLRKLNEEYHLGLTLQGEKWTQEKVLKELKKLHSKGISTTQANLAKIGRNDLLGAIYKYGTLNSFKEKLGISVTRQNYWTDDKIIDELKPIIAELGTMPSGPMLNAMGKSDLQRAIAKRGGHIRFCELLHTSISKYYVSEDGHFLQSSYECIFDNILYKYGIPHEVHALISENHKHLCDFIIGGTYIEIAGFNKKDHPTYHANLKHKVKLYKKLNKHYLIVHKNVFTKSTNKIEEKVLSLLKGILPVKPTSDSYLTVSIRPPGYWADIENIKKELLPLVEKYGRMPLDKELRNERKASIIDGIYKYHTNLYELGKVLNIPVVNKPKGYYTYKKAITIYTELCNTNSKYLSVKELIQLKLSAMVKIVQKNGGMKALKQICNPDLSFIEAK